MPPMNLSGQPTTQGMPSGGSNSMNPQSFGQPQQGGIIFDDMPSGPADIGNALMAATDDVEQGRMSPQQYVGLVRSLSQVLMGMQSKSEPTSGGVSAFSDQPY